MSSAAEGKAVASAMIALWEHEIPSTIKVLNAVPDAHREHRPAPKSRSAWQLATHIATSDAWFLDCIERGQFHFDQEAAAKAAAQFNNVGDVVEYYTATIPAKLHAMNQLPGEKLAETVDFYGRMQLSRGAWIGFATNHSVHHRGQLSTYLRNMGSKVPDIYGPSADSEP
jgi:uncharacterized damage-inducible protein DinB